MDTVTHGLTGWLISRAIPTGEGKREAAAAVVVGSILPDADHIASVLGSELYLRAHRGISHSFVGVAVTSLLVALLFYRFGKWKDLKKLSLLVLLGQLSHIVLDLLNSYGTQIFQPFSDARVAFDLLFVVDLAFTGVIVTGILLSRYSPRPARTALAVLVAYVGLATFMHIRAEDAVRTAAVRQGVAVVSAWALPRLAEIQSPPDFAPGSRAEAAEEVSGPGSGTGRTRQLGFTGFPFPAGPFSWNGFVDDGKTYLRAEVDPFDGEVVWKDRAMKGNDVPEAQALRDLQEVRTYLWFARFPTVHVSTAEGKTVVTFFDLRFGGVASRRPFTLKVIEAPGLPPLAHWGS